MDSWIDDLAGTLSEEPLTPAETGAVLKLARDVAHGAERKLAPLSTYLAGVYAGRRASTEVTSRQEALREATELARRILPDASPS